MTYDMDDENVELLQAEPINAPNGAIMRAEFDVQVATAKKFPRSVKTTITYARDLATMNQEIAESCSYILKRSGKNIEGASIRLAEIVCGAWGNMHCASYIVEEQQDKIVARACAWDMERNVKIIRDVSRRITDKTGKRYQEDMVIVTGNAAASIAMRNAIFAVVPKSYVEDVRASAKEVALGKAKGLEARRSEVVDRIRKKYGLDDKRIFGTLGIAGIADMGWDHVETLIGLGTAIHEGHQTIEDAFPMEPGTGTPAQPPAKGRLKPAAKITETKPETNSGTPFDDAPPPAGEDDQF